MPLDLPTWTNAGGLVLALLVALCVALAAANRPPKCERCGQRVPRSQRHVGYREWHPDTGSLLLCLDCFLRTFR